MPGHRDNASNSTEHIVSLSVGATRPFEVYPGRTSSGRPAQYTLQNGDLVAFNGHRRYHRVPAEPDSRGERFNLTFREVHAPAGLAGSNLHLQ